MLCCPLFKTNSVLTDVVEEDCCWICLEPCSKDTLLKNVCSCKNVVHKLCLDKWRYTRRGTQDEIKCGICEVTLPPTMFQTVIVFMNDMVIGSAISSLGYEIFLDSIKQIFINYGIDQHRYVVDIICKGNNVGTKVYKGAKYFNKAIKHKIISARIRDISELL